MYFADDKDGESLQQDWAKAQPSDKEAKQGWLAGWGISCDAHIGFTRALQGVILESTMSRGVEWLLKTGFEDALLQSKLIFYEFQAISQGFLSKACLLVDSGYSVEQISLLRTARRLTLRRQRLPSS